MIKQRREKNGIRKGRTIEEKTEKHYSSNNNKAKKNEEKNNRIIK